MKTVLPAAGIGKRLFPTTKTIPKELLPIYSRVSNNTTFLIPTIQVIFEQLYQNKISNFCFVTRQGEKSIKEHFTQNYQYQNHLNVEQKKLHANFFRRIRNSDIRWICQKKPIGFGNAVKLAEKYVGKDDFIVHATDTVIISKQKHPITRFYEIAKKDPTVAAVLLCKKVKDPTRFGVAKLKKISPNTYEVKEVQEKPLNPKSNMIILGLYFFKPIIFECLKKIRVGHGNEYQLTDAIQKLIQMGKKVVAIKLEKDEVDLDIGTVKSYRNALETSYRQLVLKQNSLKNI
tara:strand:+ start:633 stop:1499 length:867 start_codon:yes stop_codon:yes gene_type:complete